MVTQVRTRPARRPPPPMDAVPPVPAVPPTSVVPPVPVPPKARRPRSSVTRSMASSVGRAVAGPLGWTGERMSKVDTAWLRMDSEANRMVILGVWMLRPGLSHADLCQRVTERLLPYARFSQCAVEDASGASWVSDLRFDLHHHVQRERLAPGPLSGPAARSALQIRVAQLAVEPLDRSRPLWQFHLVEQHDGGSALIARIHHCIADGIALITVMMSLMDGGQLPAPVAKRRAANAAAASASATVPAAGLGEHAQAWVADSLLKPLAQLTVKMLDAAGGGVTQSVDLLKDPTRALDVAQHVGRLGGQVLKDMAALAFMPDDARTSLKGRLAARKAVAWCDPLPLDEVKAVGKALGCSVNDVLLSGVAGALGAYLKSRGEPVAGQEIRAMVPVNLRPLDQAWTLGNRFGLVPLVLPLGIDNPIERVYAVRERMQSLKGSTQPLLAFALLSVAGLLVKPAQDLLLGMFSRKTTAVMTNVPGPADKLTLCGSTLEQTMFWVPQSGDVGVGVSILSYGGGVQFGLITDTALCAEPQRIIDAFEPQFASLSWLTLMLPWGSEAQD